MKIILEGKCNCCSVPEDKEMIIDIWPDHILISIDEKEIKLNKKEFEMFKKIVP